MKKAFLFPLTLIILCPFSVFAQGTSATPTSSSDGTGIISPSTTPISSTSPIIPAPAPSAASITPTAAQTPVRPAPKIIPKSTAPTPVKTIPAVIKTSSPINSSIPSATPVSTGNNYIEIILGILTIGLGTAIFLKLKTKRQDKKKSNLKCPSIQKLIEEKLNDLIDLKGQLTDMMKDKSVEQIKNITEGTKAEKLLSFIEERNQEYQKLKELYEKCITNIARAKKVFIFHGTEGYPEENWFPWLKEILSANGVQTFVPQFPSPPGVPAKIPEWFKVLKDYEKNIDENTILVAHSLGGLFALRILEKLDKPVHAVFFVSTPIGVQPLSDPGRYDDFGGFDFNWEKIKKNSGQFHVFQSDNDPYVGLGNGKVLAQNLDTDLSFISNAGHFNKKAGYTKFEELWKKIEPLLNS